MPIRRSALAVSLVIGVFVMALPAGAAAEVPHVVLPGESLTSVARTDGLSIASLAAANDLSPNAELLVGQILQIPALTPYTAAKPTVAVSTTATASTTATVSRTTVTTTAAPKAAVSSTESGPDPTAQRVSAAEIAEIADADGVPPGLAEGIAWQESGWNNDVVSGIGAVGVMQIVPSTWSWIDQYLTPADPLAPASASENVRGGVLLLHELLAVTGGNQELAVASYYQGLSSVREHGMYPDTRQYVADVLALAGRFGS
jgi:soluble lytic murein transglycosylase-like protein